MKKIKGIWSIINNQDVIEILSQANNDFLIFDMEHGNFSKKDVHSALSYCQNYNKLGFVRIPINETGYIQSALDSGCDGLIFPRVENRKDALNCISQCYFAPRGKRGFNPFTRFNQYTLNKKKIKKKLLKVIMIETRKSIENIEEIISVSGVDIIYFGIFDLSMEYGLKINDKKLTNIIENGMIKCRKHKKEIGLMTMDKNSQILSKKFNAKFILKGVDTDLLAQTSNK